MPFRGRRRFISLLVYKMYKPLTSAPGRFAFPVSSLWPLAVPSETMTMDIRAAKEQIVGHLRKAPKVSSPVDLQSYVGSPVPVLGLTVPTMRAIVAGFAKEHRRLTAAERNALASALWSDLCTKRNRLRFSFWVGTRRFSTMTRGGSRTDGSIRQPV